MTSDLDKCNTLALKEQWFLDLVEECRDIVTETEFASCWSLVEGRHLLGKRILEEYDKFERIRMADNELVSSIAISIKRSRRTVYYSIQFARMFPDLNLLPEGKNVRWGHVVNKYLITGEKKVSITKGVLMKQIEEIKKLLDTEWRKSHSVVMNGDPDGRTDYYKDQCEFIRYLQDQVNKIIGDGRILGELDYESAYRV